MIENDQNTQPTLQIPPTPPQPVPPLKNNSGILIGILLLLLGILLGLTLDKTTILSNIRIPYLSATPTPTPLVTPTPTPDPTANWKTYTHNGISFQYPENWTQNPEQLSGSGWSVEIVDPQNIYTLTFSERGNYNQETGKPYADLKEYVRMPYVNAVTVNGEPGDKTLPRAGSENDNQVVFFSKDVKSIYTLELDTNRNRIDKVEEGQKTFDQILSTFRFENTTSTPTQATSNAKILTYQLPTGWTKVSDPTSRFEAAYDPSNTQLLEAGVEGLNLTKKQANDNGIGYKSYMSIRLLPYDGGSRHTFIYKYMSNNQPPQKQDLGADYNEKEYLYNNKSCLFLRGIYTSQMPNIWGMCDTGGGNAFLVTSYNPDYETTVQTIKLLK